MVFVGTFKCLLDSLLSDGITSDMEGRLQIKHESDQQPMKSDTPFRNGSFRGTASGVESAAVRDVAFLWLNR